jgi:lipoprotein-anchoring transpeptidase ErfK/SrfK
MLHDSLAKQRDGVDLPMLRSFALIAVVVAGTAGPAAAQYYPPSPYDPRYAPPPPGRSLPPLYEDDEDMPEDGYYRAPPSYRPGRVPPADPRYVDPGRDLPPPGQAGPPGPYDVPYATVPRYSAPPPGVAVEPDYPGPPRPPGVIGPPPPAPPREIIASLPPEDQPETGEPKELAPQFRRQMVDYRGREPAGTLVIDTPNTFLYLVLGNGKALRYGIGVGREGFTWSGEERISKMQEWPDWHPPVEMIQRQPYLPRFMAGGPGNPLGARALYLGHTLYRIHGTNQPSTIGQFVSSGCIRLLNEDVEDLYGRVSVGTRVVVLPGGKGPTAAAQ